MILKAPSSFIYPCFVPISSLMILEPYCKRLSACHHILWRRYSSHSRAGVKRFLTDS